jgi:hypothetical protein
MKYLILVHSRHADPEAYGPFGSESEAVAALKLAEHRFWNEAGEDGSVEIIPLRGYVPK